MTGPCIRCGHEADAHRHDDDQLGPDCHGPDGHHQCRHFRCTVTAGPHWTGADRDTCACPNYVDPTPILVQRVEEFAEGVDLTHTLEWYCEPPEAGVPHIVTDQTWSGGFNVRRVFGWIST